VRREAPASWTRPLFAGRLQQHRLCTQVHSRTFPLEQHEDRRPGACARRSYRSRATPQQFEANTYRVFTFALATGGGLFDAELRPDPRRPAELKIKVKLYFDYKQDDDNPWSQSRKRTFVTNLKKNVAATWNGNVTFTAAKQGWPAYVVKPVVEVVEVQAAADAHYVVDAWAGCATCPTSTSA
jgi:hypothetical protein